jgi:hypothetical protein
MKPVLLTVAVILACVVYETDRGSRLRAEWHSEAIVGRVLNAQPGDLGMRMPGSDESGPHEAEVPGVAAGRIEREKSIRLFGPGVSRKQQIRV